MSLRKSLEDTEYTYTWWTRHAAGKDGIQATSIIIAEQQQRGCREALLSAYSRLHHEKSIAAVASNKKATRARSESSTIEATSRETYNF